MVLRTKFKSSCILKKGTNFENMYEWMYLDPNKKNSKMFHFISFSGKIFFNQKLQKGKIENCHKYLNPLPNQIFRQNSVKHAWPKCCIRYGGHWSWRFFNSALILYVLGALFSIIEQFVTRILEMTKTRWDQLAFQFNLNRVHWVYT